ncbi:MAG: hypothetical protein ACR2N2_04745 [Acidimicrobiia bacterium]
MRRVSVVMMVAVAMVLTVLAPAGADTGKPEGVGLHDPTTGIWYLLNGDGTSTSFYYGNPGDYAVMGDWDCDGTDTPGLYRQSDGYVYLRNSNTQGIADIRFFFGNPGDVPLAGDFNADGCDTISIWRPSENRVYIINKLGANDGGLGAAEFFYDIGNPGDLPIVGDFNGSGTDTVGLHRQSTSQLFLRNSLSSGPADTTIVVGGSTDIAFSGDWDGNNTDTFGIYQAPSFYAPTGGVLFMRDTNAAGNPDYLVNFGDPGWRPVSGVFKTGTPGIPGPTPPPLPEIPGVTTAKDILDGKVPTFDQDGGRILMVGEATRRIDQDDYRFSDGTGEIRIDVASSLDQNLPLFTCMIISGIWTGTEVNVEAYASCSSL